MEAGLEDNLEMTFVTKLQLLWRPFFILMRISGLTFPNDPSWNPPKFYSLLIVFFSWTILVLHFITLFDIYDFYGLTFDVNVESMKQMTMLLHVIQTSVKCSGIFLAFHRQDCMKRVFQLWSAIRLPCEISQRLEASICRSARVAVTVAVILFVVSVMFEFCTWTVEGYETAYFAPYTVIAFIDCVTSVFCWLLVTTMTELFSTVNDCFVQRNLNSRMSLDDLCSSFYTAADMVSAADGSLDVVFGGHLLINLLQSCLETYILIFDPTGKAVSLFMTIYWCTLVFFRFFFIFWGAANVNEKAHRLLSGIHLLPVKNLSSYEMVQMQVLQTRLSSHNIGFSMFGVQTITRGMLPVLLSGYATYVFLLAQFHLGKKTPNYDCFGLLNNTL